MQIIFQILVTAFSLLLVAWFLPGIEVESLYAAIVAAIVLSILNAVVKPLLVLLTLPVTLLTFGLFIFVINAGLFMFAASFIDGFSVDSFFSALLGSCLVSLVSTVSYKLTS